MLRVGVIMYQTSLTKGQELTAQRMVKEFRRLGYEAYLITSNFQDWECIIPSEKIRERGGFVHLYDDELGIPVIRVEGWIAQWPPRRIFLRDFVSVLSKIVEDLKLNVLITHSTLWNGPEDTARFVEWKRSMAKSGAVGQDIVFCHMSHFQEPSEDRYMLDERSYRDTWNRMSMPLILKEADLVLVTTPYEMKQMLRMGADKEKLFLFPAGIDTDSLETPSRQSILEKRIPEGKKIITFLGTVEERKNVLGVLEIARLLSKRKDIHFVIAGRLEGDYGTRVKDEAEKLDNVTLLGQIGDDQKAELIRRTTLNIIMSKSEALGITQLEFQYLGVPVVSSGVGGQKFAVRDGVTGIIVNGPVDVKGALRAIEKLVDNKSLRERMAKEAAKYASYFAVTKLVHNLSRRLIGIAQDMQKEQNEPKIPLTEKAIEAWIKDNQRVIATTARLIIQFSEKKLISIPYSEIINIKRHVKAKWWMLFLGLCVFLLFMFARVTGLSADTLIGKAYRAVFMPYFPEPIKIFLPFLILALSMILFASTIESGFIVNFTGGKIFLSQRFEKALRLADRFTPYNLFEE